MDTVELTITGPEGSREMPLTGEPISFGRQLGNTLTLSDDLVSRFHAVIERDGDGTPQVRDLGSRNGTKVNGEPIAAKTATFLRDGDTVTVGRTEVAVLVRTAKQEAARQAAEMAAQRMGANGGKPSGPAESIDLDRPPAQTLSRLALSLPEQNFGPSDFALINARGQVAHPSKGNLPKNAEPPSEALTLLRLVLLVCFRTHASDIHVEPKGDTYLVRSRIDGSMVDIAKMTKDVGVRFTSLVKILCDIDIAQRNQIQEGRFSARTPDRKVDYRVSFTPAMFGQKLVVRVLDAANGPRYLWDLGLPPWMQKEMEKALRRDSGTVIVCGPTGSGKTNTLYAAMRSVDTGERNCVTIEDPVEIALDGITQMPVNEDQGNTFPNLLRSTLRQDPDVVMVGEIRDGETAGTAMQAAMTGHLVLSTVHSRDTVGTIFRLLDLGVEPYLVSSAVHVVLAQRLVRKLCNNCKRAMPVTEEQQEDMPAEFKESIKETYRPVGCPKCLGTGYSGRRGVFEMLPATDVIRDMILKSPSPLDIHKALEGTKFRKLSHNGFDLVAEGVTTVEEVERVVQA